jgi:hypothetical protein
MTIVFLLLPLLCMGLQHASWREARMTFRRCGVMSSCIAAIDYLKPNATVILLTQCSYPTGSGSRSFEKPWNEIVQTAAPRQPLVGRAGRLEIHVLDTGLGQPLAKVLGAGAFQRADSQE